MESTTPAPANREATDEALMHEVTSGRQEALETLHHRYAPRVFGFTAQILDRTTAEEIVQEVFFAVWRKAGTFDPTRGRFRPWVFQIAHHRIVNELRRRGRRPQLVDGPVDLGMPDLPDPAPDPDEIVAGKEQRATVLAAVEALPPAQRRAVGLAFFEDRTHEEVATELHLPLGTVKTRIRAGLQRLRAGFGVRRAGHRGDRPEGACGSPRLRRRSRAWRATSGVRDAIQRSCISVTDRGRTARRGAYRGRRSNRAQAWLR